MIPGRLVYSGIGGAIRAAQPEVSRRDIFSVLLLPRRVYLKVSVSSPVRVNRYFIFDSGRLNRRDFSPDG